MLNIHAMPFFRSEWAKPVVVLTIVGITLLHYLTGANFLPYHSMYRSLYYLPISVAAITWGLRGGLVTSLWITALYLPHVLLMGEMMPGGFVDNILEVVLFVFVGVLAGTLADAQRVQRRRAETLRAYMHDILTSLPVGVATINEQGMLETRNPAASQLLQPVRGLQELPTLSGYYERSLGDRPVGIRCSPLHSVDGVAVGKVLVLEDLSEQRHLAEQVRKAERLAALGQLAGGLAHEVRNPLAIVRATAQLLARRLHDRGEVAQHIAVLTTESDRIERLISDLLNYASPHEPHMETFPITPFLQELVAAVTPYAEQYGITLHAQPDCAIPTIYADQEQIRQVLVNLLLNAIQASPAGAAVELCCRVGPEQLCFTVADCGPGIPAELRTRVFDPFYTTRDDGTGMGLAVVARIITDHGGTVHIDDAAGGGTEVSVCLPRAGEAL